MLWIIEFLIKLFMAHAMGDFVLQTEIMSKLKSRYNKPDFIPNGQKYVPTWGFWLSAHGLVHGGLIYFFTGNIWLGALETILHCGIDFLKCENVTNPYIDQLLHCLCKILYVLLIV